MLAGSDEEGEGGRGERLADVHGLMHSTGRVRRAIKPSRAVWGGVRINVDRSRCCAGTTWVIGAE